MSSLCFWLRRLKIINEIFYCFPIRNYFENRQLILIIIYQTYFSINCSVSHKKVKPWKINSVENQIHYEAWKAFWSTYELSFTNLSHLFLSFGFFYPFLFLPTFFIYSFFTSKIYFFHFNAIFLNLRS